jgi:hypothetical protein
MKTRKKIPWEAIGNRLGGKRDQKWFGEQLGAEKNVVSNWKARGGIPMEHVDAIAKIFGISIEELIGFDAANASNTDRKGRLSDEALDLILWVIQLDRLGDLARKTFSAHKGLLQLSAAAAELHDLPRALQSAEEITRALEARMTATEESPHERNRT